MTSKGIGRGKKLGVPTFSQNEKITELIIYGVCEGLFMTKSNNVSGKWTGEEAF